MGPVLTHVMHKIFKIRLVTITPLSAVLGLDLRAGVLDLTHWHRGRAHRHSGRRRITSKRSAENTTKLRMNEKENRRGRKQKSNWRM